jgi:uncharacterized protein (DUF983 family)
MIDRSKLTGILRGFGRKCPNCGKTKLFDGFLSVRSPCGVCGIDNEQYPADDLPPYLTISAVGHLVIPTLIWFDFAFTPALWIEVAIWLPVTAILSLLLLPSMKGATVGICWATNTIRPGYASRPD